MKYIIVIIYIGLLIGCKDKANPNKGKWNELIPITIINDGYNNQKRIYLYEVDGCEYIGYINGYQSDILTHKGNCKFCEQRRKRT